MRTRLNVTLYIHCLFVEYYCYEFEIQNLIKICYTCTVLCISKNRAKVSELINPESSGKRIHKHCYQGGGCVRAPQIQHVRGGWP